MTVSTKINSAARIQALGDRAVTLEFGNRVDRRISAQVMLAREAVAAAGIRGVVELVPTFRALAVHFDPAIVGYEELAGRLGALDLPEGSFGRPGRSLSVPVLYDGPDLAALAEAAGMTPKEAAALHAATPCHVYMLGFLPGFAYLGDLPEKLRMPRRKEPRTRVPPGSVAVAEQMTAVYPVESPGGWHLIGRTPLRLFDHRKEPPSLLLPGDAVRFEPVTEAEFERLRRAAEAA